MKRSKHVSQQFAIVVVVPSFDDPSHLRCAELIVTIFKNGDWEITGDDPVLCQGGDADAFERSSASLFLRMRARSQMVS